MKAVINRMVGRYICRLTDRHKEQFGEVTYEKAYTCVEVQCARCGKHIRTKVFTNAQWQNMKRLPT